SGAEFKYPNDYPHATDWERYFAQIAVMAEQLDREHPHALVIAGDLTHDNTIEQAQVLAPLLAKIKIPKIAVKGNHDFRGTNGRVVQQLFEDAGVIFLEEDYTVLDVHDQKLAFYGFSGFPGKQEEAETARLPHLSDRMMRNHAYTEMYIPKLRTALTELEAQGIPTVIITHYAPTADTIDATFAETQFPSKQFSHPVSPNLHPGIVKEIDRHAAIVRHIFHGHTHDTQAPFRGFPFAKTPAGISVENVAAPMLLRLPDFPPNQPPVVRRRIH
ncbi:MAG: metallophosphoesterase, partial [Patescibacteria group bacterium]|nr:metallophosphoesterase [Patescibacteria group bacterium]